jgi:hypothetical protein
MFDVLLQYDLYSKTESLDIYYKNDKYLNFYKLYKKFNDKNNIYNIAYTRELKSFEEKISPTYYQGYIDS